MTFDILRTVGQVAGLGGLALGILLLLYRDVIRLKVFRRLSADQSFRVIVLLLVLVWSVALAGLGGWAWLEAMEKQARRNASLPGDQEPGNEIERVQGQLRPIYFAAGSYSLSSYADKRLNEYAELLRGGQFSVVISGHSNEHEPVGNVRLGEARAERVKNRLMLLGVEPVLMTTESYGAERPLKAGFSLYNDRVEFKVSAIR